MAGELILSLSLLSGILLLDKFAFGQFGLSSPIVSAPLLGLLFGERLAGIWLGIIFQVLFLSSYPLGGKDLPDKEGGAICAVATFILSRRVIFTASPSGEVSLFSSPEFFFATTFGLVASFLGKELERGLKIANRKVPHLFGLATSFARGFLLCLVLLVIASVLLPAIRELIGRTPAFRFLVPLSLGCTASALFPSYIRLRGIELSSIGLFLLGGLFAVGLWVIKR